MVLHEKKDLSNITYEDQLIYSIPTQRIYFNGDSIDCSTFDGMENGLVRVIPSSGTTRSCA